jgi:hypothetical protein
VFGTFGDLRSQDIVAGTLTVIGISRPRPGTVISRYKMDAVVLGPGVQATSVMHRGVAPVAKWPKPGTVLPVRVNRIKPERLVIDWDSLPDRD